MFDVLDAIRDPSKVKTACLLDLVESAERPTLRSLAITELWGTERTPALVGRLTARLTDEAADVAGRAAYHLRLLGAPGAVSIEALQQAALRADSAGSDAILALVVELSDVYDFDAADFTLGALTGIGRDAHPARSAIESALRLYSTFSPTRFRMDLRAALSAVDADG